MSGSTTERLQSLVLNTLDALPADAKLDSNDLVLEQQDGAKLTFREGESQVLLKGVLDSLLSRDVSHHCGKV